MGGNPQQAPPPAGRPIAQHVLHGQTVQRIGLETAELGARHLIVTEKRRQCRYSGPCYFAGAAGQGPVCGIGEDDAAVLGGNEARFGKALHGGEQDIGAIVAALAVDQAVDQEAGRGDADGSHQGQPERPGQTNPVEHENTVKERPGNTAKSQAMGPGRRRQEAPMKRRPGPLIVRPGRYIHDGSVFGQSISSHP